jgi:hypothetical protein
VTPRTVTRRGANGFNFAPGFPPAQRVYFTVSAPTLQMAAS